MIAAMERPWALNVAPTVATVAMIKLATSRPRRRWSYSLPIVLVMAIVGLALPLGHTVASHGAFQLVLLVVLAAAVGLGLGPALATVAVGVATAIAGMQLVQPSATALLVADVGLLAAEGTTVAFVGGVARAAIGAALKSPAQSPVERSAAPAQEGLVEPLTPRELEVLRSAASGRSATELADELCLSVNTVKTHLAHCYDKLGARNRAEAVVLGLRCGCLEAADLEGAALAATGGAPATRVMLRQRITRQGEADRSLRP
jgi:DNA-binding CsgD family transcriptional regulator